MNKPLESGKLRLLFTDLIKSSCFTNKQSETHVTLMVRNGLDPSFILI